MTAVLEAPGDLSHEEFEAWHAAAHPELVEGCFACKLDTISVSAAIHAPRATRSVPPRRPDNPWERGVAGEHRVDGSFMPYVDKELAPLSVKQFADHRGHNEATIRDYRAGHVPPVNA